MGNMGMEFEQKKSLMDMVEKLPDWAQTAVSILAIIAAAAVAGWLVGKMYAMVKYPDPEKQGVVHPVIKLIFICLLAGCCVWLYITMMNEKNPQPEPDMGSEIHQAENSMGYPAEYGIAVG